MNKSSKNVFGQTLKSCSMNPMTGFFRNGCCDSGPDDYGKHTLCAVMTSDFLMFSRSRGNDLVTPIPQYHFPGLHPGDRWCICVLRWKEAHEAGYAPPVVLEATNENALEYVEMNVLLGYAYKEMKKDSE